MKFLKRQSKSLPEVKFYCWDKRATFEIYIIDTGTHFYNDVYVYHLPDKARHIYFCKHFMLSTLHNDPSQAKSIPLGLSFAWKYKEIFADPWEL